MRCAGLVHLVVPGQFPVIEIRRERDEPGGAEAIRHLLDAGIEAPPFLDDQNARARIQLAGFARYPDAMLPLLRNSTVSAMRERITWNARGHHNATTNDMERRCRRY